MELIFVNKQVVKSLAELVLSLCFASLSRGVTERNDKSNSLPFIWSVAWYEFQRNHLKACHYMLMAVQFGGASASSENIEADGWRKYMFDMNNISMNYARGDDWRCEWLAQEWHLFNVSTSVHDDFRLDGSDEVLTLSWFWSFVLDSDNSKSRVSTDDWTGNTAVCTILTNKRNPFLIGKQCHNLSTLFCVHVRSPSTSLLGDNVTTLVNNH